MRDRALQRRVTELEAEREQVLARERERSIRYAAIDAASKLGFRDPDLAVRLVDPSAVETKDDGTPKNVERLVADVLARSPYLGRSGVAPDFGGGQRGATASGTDMNSLIRPLSGRLRPDLPEGSTWSFSAYVTGFSNSAPVDGHLCANVTLRPSGAPVFAAAGS